MGLPILLKEPNILIVGAGNVAKQKAQVLYDNSIEFTMIAKEYLDETKEYCKNYKEKSFDISDIVGYDYIIDATGNMEVTNQLLEAKKNRFFLLNVVDVPQFCDFYFQALVNAGKLQISVSSNGASPSVAKIVRDNIKTLLPRGLGSILEDAAYKRAQGIIDIDGVSLETKKAFAKAYIIGCGTGDIDLLTIKAYKCIQKLDIALVDHLISEEIKEIIPSTCEIIDVGKQKGFHRKKQEEINELLLQYLKQGKNVGRLKSGDPYLFGRGAEEVVYLQEAGIENIEVIPGVTSALSGATSAGVPVTHRGISNSFSVVTAHLKDNSLNLDWIDLLKREQHTTVVLMGLSRIEKIQKAALELGVSGTLPCAVISNATRKNQKVVISTLEKVSEVKYERQPSIIVFGEVALLGEKLPAYMPDSLIQSLAT